MEEYRPEAIQIRTAAKYTQQTWSLNIRNLPKARKQTMDLKKPKTCHSIKEDI